MWRWGHWKFPLPLPKTKIDDRSVDVRFTYDVNGLLEVEADGFGIPEKARRNYRKNARRDDPRRNSIELG